MQNILVTGGNGFIASHLVDALASEGNKITVLDIYPRQYEESPKNVRFIQGNLQDLQIIRRAIEDGQIEVVYHAAWATIHESALKDPVGDVEVNLIPTITLLNTCLEAGIKRVIFLSSGGTVYGLPEKLPISETHPTNPINAYGITKLMAEKYLRMFHHLYGLEYVILRPSVPFGPRQNPFHRQGVVPIFIYKTLMGEPITIFGDGDAVRDFFYIDDLTRALVASKDVRFDPRKNTFNLGGMVPYSLNSLIEIIESELGVKVQKEYTAPRNFDVPYLLLDTSFAQSQMGWKPIVTLEKGIKHTAEWMKKWIIDRP